MDKDLSFKKELVSIIIPTYNDSEFLDCSIKSALSQTYKNIEIIVINDGSKRPQDKEYFDNFKYTNQVKLINKENQGLASARNTGLEISQGEFFVPLDSDDMIDQAFVEKTLAIAKLKDEIGVVYTDQIWFGEENKKQKVMDFDFEFLLFKNFISVCSLVKRSAYEKVRSKNGVGYNPNMLYGYEDWDFWISIAELGYEFRTINEALFKYRKKRNTMAKTAIEKHDYLIDQIIKNHEASYRNNSITLIKSIQSFYKEREMYAQHLENNINNPIWLAKRFIKKLLRL
jgi:glycosyltransferase involved in cell wall biosynthesis